MSKAFFSRVIQDCVRERAISMETLSKVSSLKTSKKESEQFSIQEPASLKLSLPSGSSKKGTESQMEGRLLRTESVSVFVVFLLHVLSVSDRPQQ